MKIFRSKRRRIPQNKQPQRRLWIVCGCISLVLLYMHLSTSIIMQQDESLLVGDQVVVQPRTVNSGWNKAPQETVIHSQHQQQQKQQQQKQQQQKQQQQQQHHHHHYHHRRNMLSLWPNPTLVVGLPKMGTKTIYDYFVCGGVRNVSHYRCRDKIKCGLLINNNALAQKPPLHGTGAFNVYTQLDITAFRNNTEGLPCYYPQVELLHEMHKHYPYSTLILNKRNVTAWVASVERWFSMHQRLVQCNITGFGVGVGKTSEELVQFYETQVHRVRQFVKRYPLHRLVEVEIDSPNAGQVMQNAFGIDKDCWGHGNNAKEMPILKKVEES